MSHSVRMKKIQLAAMLLICFGLLAFTVPLVCTQFMPKPGVQSFDAPGFSAVNFESSGPGVIYYEQFLDASKAVQQEEKQALARLKMEISHSGAAQGELLPLTKAWEEHLYRQDRHKGISLFKFQVKAPGHYTVYSYYASGSGPALRMSLGRGAADSRLIRIAIVSLIAVVNAVIIFTLLFFVMKIGKSNH